MALRPPSNQKQRDDFYSGDPAFVQLARGELDDAGWLKAQLERRRKVVVARETGDWSPLRVDGTEPTTFVMRPISSTTFRTLIDNLNANKIGNSLAVQISFRAALADLKNFGDLAVRFEKHPEYGELAHVEVVNALDALDPGIVGELGFVAFERARQVSPK